MQQVAWAPENGLARVLKDAWAFFGGMRAPLAHFNISWRAHMWVIPVIARLRSRARLVGSMRAMPERYEDTPRRRYFGVVPGLQLWKLPDLLVGRVWARALHATVSVNRDDYPPRLVQEFGFPRGRLSVIYNGVVLPEQAPDAAQRQAARARFKCPEGAFVLAYVGRVSKEKGLRYAIEALSSCAGDVHLLVAGIGDDLEATQALVRELGLESRVHFLGYVPDPQSVFCAAEVAVVPSLWNEAFGRVVVEAMGCAVPVIATTVGGMQELFDDGIHGAFVPKADAPAIAAAVNRLHADRSRLAAASAAARRLAVERYSTQRVAQEYGSLYERVAHA